MRTFPELHFTRPQVFILSVDLSCFCSSFNLALGFFLPAAGKETGLGQLNVIFCLETWCSFPSLCCRIAPPSAAGPSPPCSCQAKKQ